MTRITTFALPLGVVLLAACGGADEAGEAAEGLDLPLAVEAEEAAAPADRTDAVRAALDAHLAQNPECVVLPLSQEEAYDATVELPEGTMPDGRTMEETVRAQYGPLAEAGLIEMSVVPMTIMGREIPVMAMTVTEEGQRFARPEGTEPAAATGVDGRPASELCYATGRVTDLRATEPRDGLGVGVLLARYDYVLEDVAGWARTDAFQAAYPEIARDLGAPVEAEDFLVETTDGLVVTDDF